MSAIMELEKRFQALLEALDALAAQSTDDDLEEMNAELEDALFMLSEIDPKAGDWREELQDTLEAMDALRGDYARRPDTSEIAVRMAVLIRMAETLTKDE